MKKTIGLLVVAIAIVTAFGFERVAKASSDDKASTVQRVSAPHTYRLDYTISQVENGKRLNSRTYTIICEDAGGATKGVLKLGSRYPVVTGGSQANPELSQFQYLDLGMNIDAVLRVSESGGLSLESHFEMSSADDGAGAVRAQAGGNPVIRQLRVATVNQLVPGKTVNVATADDVSTNRQYQVQVVATEL